MRDLTHFVQLTCHPHARTDVVRGVAARVHRSRDGTLAITFVLDADVARLRIPPPQTSRIASGLWEHTCFEMFVALGQTPAYHEFNFAPSHEWALFAFHGYREIAPLPAAAPAPEIVVRRAAEQLELDAAVHLDCLSAAHATAPLRLALSAVIEDESGRLSSWALRHPAGKPDFHHAGAFALTIDAPSGAPSVDSGDDPR